MTIDNGLIEEIRRLRREGLTISAISKALGISRPTVYKVLNESEAPEGSHEIKHKGSLVSKPHLKAIPVENPSNQLKRVREETEATLLEVDRAKALKELEALTRRPPLSLEEKRALLEETKIDLELKRLRSEELSEERKKKASEIVERIKLSVLPKPFRDELPAVVVYRILLKITEELSKVDPLSTPEDELTAIAKLARDSVLSEVRPSELSPAVVRAFSRAIFDYLHAVHRASAPQMDFDSFLGNLFLDLLKKDQDAFIELITNLTAFVNSIGDDESRNRFNTKVQSLIGILGQGGDANGKGLPV